MKVASIDDYKARRTLRRSALDTIALRMVFRLFSGIRRGRLTVEDEGETYTFGDVDPQASLVAHVSVHHPSVFRDVMLRGSIGAGEAYMLGAWSSPDLLKVIRLMLANMALLEAMDSRMPSPSKWLLKGFHALRSNTLSGSRKNISAHYDLGNDFFRLFLDPEMMYSAAIFPRDDSDLDEAAVFKLDHICRRLRLRPSDHLLEIGTGWGGMAIHAARHYGCRVTTTTISREQYEYARARVAEEGLEDRVTVLMQDYRALQGEYDKLVSIEMIEAVGHRFYPVYFSTCARLLKPDGMALIQAITIPDQRFDSASQSVDFIQRYVFPGGCLPSVSVISRQVGQHTDMRIIGLEDISSHYARTLEAWRHRFKAALPQVHALGFDEVFTRLWEFYLCYCEGGFLERSIGTAQILLAKPECRDEPQPVG